MSSIAIYQLATGPTINPFALRSEPAIAAYLLIVAKAISLCDLPFAANTNPTLPTALVIFPLWRQATMPSKLLVVTRT